MRNLLLMILILASTSAFAAISKWVDDQGHVHYSDQPPPPKVKAQTLRSTSNSEDTVAASSVTGKNPPGAPESIAEQEAALERKKLEKQAAAGKAAQQQAAADALKASCENSQRNLMNLQAGGRMVEIDANGERSYLDDAERQKRIEKAQQEISSRCK